MESLCSVKAQRVSKPSSRRRLALRKRAKDDIFAKQVDADGIFFADAQSSFTAGISQGSDRNYVAYVDKHLKKSDLGSEEVTRGEVSQGGAQAMVSLSACAKGAGTSSFLRREKGSQARRTSKCSPTSKKFSFDLCSAGGLFIF